MYENSTFVEAEDVHFDAERDIRWNDAIPQQASECDVEWMGSEDPLFLLYTSGSTGITTLFVSSSSPSKDSGRMGRSHRLQEKAGCLAQASGFWMDKRKSQVQSKQEDSHQHKV